jgi:hypothetical protein
MKMTNANIYQRVALVVAVCATTWAAAVVAGPESETGGEAAGVNVGPGRVSFGLTRAGRWVALVPDWAPGSSAISGGGFVVFAEGENGSVEQLANTAFGGTLVKGREEARHLKPVYEGIPGGCRYPLLQRDDDGDGREDEDRLDGVDNDGDGRIDEDYAAAGDEMVALAFDARDKTGEPLLQFHQENCAWTLPHIDCMVAIRLSVRNVGKRPLNDVRIGGLVRLDGSHAMSVSTQDVGPALVGWQDERLVSKAILMTETGAGTVAGVFFAEPAAKDATWLTGATEAGRSLAGRVQAFVDAQGSAGARDDATSEPMSGVSAEREQRDGAERVVYGISPNLGVLNPGDEFVVYAALIVVPDASGADAAIRAAYRTVVGDGEHRMIPPTVSLKRRTVWGSYAVEHTGDGETPSRTTIKLENARAQGIGANDITYLSGIDMSAVETTELFDGDLELSLTGALHREIAASGARLEMYGRLKNGDIFDVVLSPDAEAQPGQRVDGMNEAQYWSRPGKLQPGLLSGSPNPFRESTTIFYEVPESVADENGTVLNFFSPVATSVKVYNVAGRLVSILVDTVLSPGQYNTSWEASDDNGNSVASGVYYVKLQIGKKHVTKRLIQLK